MNDKFDELAKGLAQSVTRRGALKKFGVSLAGIALASLGLANTANAADNPKQGKKFRCKCSEYVYGCDRYGPDEFSLCIAVCDSICSPG